MAKSTWLILSARIAQLLLGVALMIWVICVGVSWRGAEQPLMSCGAWAGGIIAVCGSCSLFAWNRRPDEHKDARLHLLLLYVDCWAFVMATTGLITSTISAFDRTYEGFYGLYTQGYEAVGPAVVCGLLMLIILPFIVRTIHLWRKRALRSAPADAFHKQQASEYELGGHTVYQPNVVYQTAYTSTHKPRTSQQTYASEIKSSPSSRPLSFADTTTTVGYPNIASHTDIPTRAPSYRTVQKS